MKIKIVAIVCILLAVLTVFGCSGNMENIPTVSGTSATTENTPAESETLATTEYIPVRQEKLTRNDVIELSKKGMELTWGDLEIFFTGRDIGSGLYIVVFDIDSEYELMVGGGWPVREAHPLYAYLRNRETGEKIDIMKESPIDFMK